MQIQAVQSSSNNLNFGMALKIDSEAQKYIRDNFSARQLKKLSKIIEHQKIIHTIFICQQILNW